jgi:galactan 5-O-arabinofuranosyltransferase
MTHGTRVAERRWPVRETAPEEAGWEGVAPRGPAPRPAADRRDAVPWRLLPVLAAAAVLTCLAVQWVISSVDLPAESNAPTAAVTWTTVGGVALLVVAAVASRLPSWVRSLLAVVTLTALTTAVLAWPLHGTAWYFGGLVSDQQFRTQYLTRLASDPALADMNYADLPPFYPAGWFWPAGRVAALSGTAPWAAFKPIALATVGLTPAAVFCVWTRLASWRAAVAIGLVTAVTSVSLLSTEPYSWPIAALVPAAAVLFWRVLHRGGRPALGRFAVIGLFLGLAGSTYTLYGAFLALLFTVLAAVHVLLAGSALRGDAVRRSVVGLVVVAAVAVVTALPAWWPFLSEVARSGFGDNVAARFLPEDSALLPEVLGADPWSLLLTAGLLALLAAACRRSAPRSEVGTALLVTVGCAYAWYGLSTLALAGGTSLLAFRMDGILVVGLGTAAVLALAEHGPRAAAALSSRGLDARRLPVAAGVLVVVAATQVVADRSEVLEPRVEAAYSTPYPGGDGAGEVDPGREEGWSDALAAEIARQAPGDPQDLVVLTTNYSLVAFEPYRSFQQISPHYANPLADHAGRTTYLEELAGSRSTEELLAGLDAAPWTPPTVFVLGDQPDGLHLKLCRDAFPAKPNVDFFDVVFDAELFASPAFRTARVGPYLVAVRQPG